MKAHGRRVRGRSACPPRDRLIRGKPWPILTPRSLLSRQGRAYGLAETMVLCREMTRDLWMPLRSDPGSFPSKQSHGMEFAGTGDGFRYAKRSFDPPPSHQISPHLADHMPSFDCAGGIHGVAVALYRAVCSTARQVLSGRRTRASRLFSSLKRFVRLPP